jgi:hypothetical protein
LRKANEVLEKQLHQMGKQLAGAKQALLDEAIFHERVVEDLKRLKTPIAYRAIIRIWKIPFGAHS